MYLKSLGAFDFRNVESLQLDFSENINFLIGDNGSGKTSVLESIYYPFHGKSFRTPNLRRIIKHESMKFVVFAQLSDEASETVIKLGVERSCEGASKTQLNGQTVKTISELAKIVPVHLLNQDSFNLLDSGPRYRRQFIDWGVFHVEHQFSQAWQSFMRVLKQRNAALKNGVSDYADLDFWNKEFSRLGMEIDQLRKSYLEAYEPVFNELLPLLMPNHSINLSFLPGWPAERGLNEALRGSFERDKRYATSHVGPHRAELKISCDDIPVSDLLSRGQQKLLVYMFRLAQAKLLFDNYGKRTIFLIDDLASEFDDAHRNKIIGLLKTLQAQMFITSIKKEDFMHNINEKELKMFHVERGCVQLMV